MSGHSKWSQIKHRKEATDKKKAVVFSKLLKAISIAAKTEPNPDFNPRLRTAVETAKQNNVPNDNIARAISKASEQKNLEEITVEAYGPESIALIIEAVTDNRNRTIQEIKNILNENGGKMGEMGSVRWAFEQPIPGGEWKPKFPQAISDTGAEALSKLVDAIEECEDVQRVFTNAE